MREIEVWSCNMRVVEIYRACQLSYAGMTGMCLGLSAQEIRAAFEVLAVPRKRWRDYATDLLVMGSAAARWINEQAKKARDKA